MNTGQTRSAITPQAGSLPWAKILILWQLVCGSQTAYAQLSGRVDSTNIGVATEDAVISSGMPDRNLDQRQFNDTSVAQQLLNTMDPDYPDPVQGAMAREMIILKFDFSTLAAGAVASSTATLEFSAWFTVAEDTPAEAAYGRFSCWEIVDGDPNWTDRFIDDTQENPAPVTWNSLGGTFVELSEIVEEDSGPPNTATENPFGVLYPGLLVSNGGFDGANRVTGIPAATVNRLITGQSVGLAIGSKTLHQGDYDLSTAVDGHDLLNWQRELGESKASTAGADGNFDGVVSGLDLPIWEDAFGSTGPAVGTTNFSIHSTESFLGPLSAPTLAFDWTASSPLLPVPEPSFLETTLAMGLSLVALQRTRV